MKVLRGPQPWRVTPRPGIQRQTGGAASRVQIIELPGSFLEDPTFVSRPTRCGRSNGAKRGTKTGSV